MLQRLGVAGIVGFLVLLGGISLLAYENLVVAAGVALVIAGIGLVVYGLVTTLMGQLGMAGMP